MLEKIYRLFQKLTSVLMILVILWAGYKVSVQLLNKIKPDKWTLFVCESLMADGVQCYSNAYVLEGYKSKLECMEKGLELSDDKGFECGINCINEGHGTVCEEICNRSGCD